MSRSKLMSLAHSFVLDITLIVFSYDNTYSVLDSFCLTNLVRHIGITSLDLQPVSEEFCISASRMVHLLFQQDTVMHSMSSLDSNFFTHWWLRLTGVVCICEKNRPYEGQAGDRCRFIYVVALHRHD